MLYVTDGTLTINVDKITIVSVDTGSDTLFLPMTQQHVLCVCACVCAHARACVYVYLCITLRNKEHPCEVEKFMLQLSTMVDEIFFEICTKAHICISQN